jgi:hypothetical protein
MIFLKHLSVDLGLYHYSLPLMPYLPKYKTVPITVFSFQEIPIFTLAGFLCQWFCVVVVVATAIIIAVDEYVEELTSVSY